MKKQPRVSIGLPVYNGEQFLRTALDSIRSQTFTDFEVIISDNASSDCTKAICMEYVEKDPRIRYHRNEQNIGSFRNFNKVFEHSTGEYFKWWAHDDYCSPDFIERCVDFLDKNPSMVLVYPMAKVINANGVVRGERRCQAKVDSQKVCERFGSLLKAADWYPNYGLIRAGVLRQIPLFSLHLSADEALPARLSLYGPFHEIPEPMMFLRFHPEQSMRKYKKGDRLGRLFYFTGMQDRITFPRWKVCMEYLSAIRKSPLSQKEQLECYLEVVKRFRWRGLIMDVFLASATSMVVLRNKMNGSSHRHAPMISPVLIELLLEILR